MDYSTYKEIKKIKGYIVVLFVLLCILSISTGVLVYFIQDDLVKIKEILGHLVHDILRLKSN